MSSIKYRILIIKHRLYRLVKIDYKISIIKYRLHWLSKIDYRPSNIEYQTSNIDFRKSNIEYRISNWFSLTAGDIRYRIYFLLSSMTYLTQCSANDRSNIGGSKWSLLTAYSNWWPFNERTTDQKSRKLGWFPLVECQASTIECIFGCGFPEVIFGCYGLRTGIIIDFILAKNRALCWN